MFFALECKTTKTYISLKNVHVFFNIYYNLKKFNQILYVNKRMFCALEYDHKLYITNICGMYSFCGHHHE